MRSRIVKIITPVGVAFWAVLGSAFLLDNAFNVWSFVWGYAGIARGQYFGPVTPYTDFMSVLTLTVLTALLLRKKVSLVSSLAISLAVILAAWASFEFWWDTLLMMHSNTLTQWTWFGLSGPLWKYVFAFNSIFAVYFISIRHWKLNLYSCFLMLLYPLSFIAWYLAGYPQPWQSASLDSALIWNITVKVLSFVSLMAPIIFFAISPASELNSNRNPGVVKTTERNAVQ